MDDSGDMDSEADGAPDLDDSGDMDSEADGALEPVGP